jgi:hypothetical protein
MVTNSLSDSRESALRLRHAACAQLGQARQTTAFSPVGFLSRSYAFMLQASPLASGAGLPHRPVLRRLARSRVGRPRDGSAVLILARRIFNWPRRESLAKDRGTSPRNDAARRSLQRLEVTKSTSSSAERCVRSDSPKAVRSRCSPARRVWIALTLARSSWVRILRRLQFCVGFLKPWVFGLPHWC